MRHLKISIEIDAQKKYVGEITCNNFKDAFFSYSKEYVEDKNNAAISISLPLQKEKFSVLQTRSFFEGLLPEGFTRRSVAQQMKVDENDYISILAVLGEECLGAIKVEEGVSDTNSDYEKLSLEQVKELAKEGAEKSAELVTKSHLSLTGASGKVGLYYNETEKNWYLPKGEAPSTHIVKQSHIRLDSIVTNEQLCLMTAKNLGIDVPESFIINVGNAKDEDVLFATRRYDRVWNDNARKINNMICPVRLHQEDFAQALGISAAKKYETKNDKYMKKMFDIIRRFSINPIEDLVKLWKIIVFDYLVGNTDAHIKNFSLLYGSDLKSICLAPAYDIVSTCVYKNSTRDMAFSIAGEYNIDKINRMTFVEAAKEVGIGQNIAMKFFDEMVASFKNALLQSTVELCNKGFEKAEELKNRILESGGISKEK